MELNPIGRLHWSGSYYQVALITEENEIRAILNKSGAERVCRDLHSLVDKRGGIFKGILDEETLVPVLYVSLPEYFLGAPHYFKGMEILEKILVEKDIHLTSDAIIEADAEFVVMGHDGIPVGLVIQVDSNYNRPNNTYRNLS
ncbi:hypothetical protein JXC34_04005 [Candidatus Woesearchaeota archaeon]|nr:hypothetical protein [Candidatus Woesearchaeota archaeon]